MTPPPAPLYNNDYSDTDYQVAIFEDLNDGDTVYVRWSSAHQQAYMYSDLDRPTQWVSPNWTIRRTIEIGLGMDREGEWFEIESNFVVIHRERPHPDGTPQMDVLNPDVDADYVKINDIIGQKWNSYTANKILLMFNVR